MKREQLLLGVILALAACGAEGGISRFSEGRIVGGEATTIEEHPYQISLVYFSSHRCGGSIITEYFVATAAHCVASLSSSLTSYLQIRVGSSYRNSGGTLYSISYFTYHDSYNSLTYDYDIAVIKVTLPFEFSTTVQPIEIPTSDYTLADGTLVAVSGWGRLSSGGSLPTVLQVVEVPVLNNTYCAELYASTNPVTDRMICAGYDEGGKDACQGDSGGPLFYENILVGIVSWGDGCAGAYQPGVYSRVSVFREWLVNQTGVDFDYFYGLVLPIIFVYGGGIRTPIVFNLVLPGGFKNREPLRINGPVHNRVKGVAWLLNDYLDPPAVSIIYNNEHVCGGSLISSRWILTAAHCIDGSVTGVFNQEIEPQLPADIQNVIQGLPLNVSDNCSDRECTDHMYNALGQCLPEFNPTLTTSLLKVRVGSTHRSSGGTLITSISSIIIHEYYDEDSYDYDVGLIQLTSTLALTTTVATVSLPSSSYTIDIGTQCTVAGWGKTSYGGTLSETLLYLTVPIVSQTSCSATYIYRNTVTDQMICAGYTTGTMDTCQGDSGGPLVYNGIQVGIVSWGAECATVGYPGVYTRVSAIREWITKRADKLVAWTTFDFQITVRIDLVSMKLGGKVTATDLQIRIKSAVVCTVHPMYLKYNTVRSSQWFDPLELVCGIEASLEEHLIFYSFWRTHIIKINGVPMHENSLFTDLTMIVRCLILLFSYPGFLQGVEQVSRIVGGSYTTIEQFPYQASLQRNGYHVCGGSIISNTWILTAGHCIRNYSYTDFKVRTGSSYYDIGGRLSSVASILVHENFNLATLDSDIAAVELTKPLAFNSHTLPIVLARRAEVPRVGQVATVTGWGTLMSSGSLSRRLQKVDLPLIGWDDCRRSYAERTITERMLCAGLLATGGQDACQGDSGGPLVLNGKLIGIVSWGFGCALPSYPGVYTRVVSFRDWIEDNTYL
ncbi:uncharacterized protein LOC124412466 [Diprion similis]|uniref:uncharacterized protein LOC124412466 n=1 Tax=Diprion similis TaxID=362088 RepID=UPI001EF88C6A|nr:uncharacterized protein LOC124412466 [Diprion similis]